MLTTSIFPGRYVQGAHALGSLHEEVASLGGDALVIIDTHIDERMHDTVVQGLGDSTPMIERFGGECSQDEIDGWSPSRTRRMRV